MSSAPYVHAGVIGGGNADLIPLKVPFCRFPAQIRTVWLPAEGNLHREHSPPYTLYGWLSVAGVRGFQTLAAV